MKKLLIFVLISCATVLCAQTRQSSTNGENEIPIEAPGQGDFQPVLSTVKNTTAEHNKMLANTYPIAIYDKDYPPTGNIAAGGATAFRLHRNWFLTCAHGRIMKMNKEHKEAISVGIVIKDRPDAPGTSAPFFLGIDLSATGENANGIVYMFNPKLQLTDSNAGRGDDLALIYVPDRDPSQSGSKGTNKDLKKVKAQLNAMKGKVPGNIIAQMVKEITKAEKASASAWQRFLNQPVNPFKLLILSDKNIIQELGYPGQTDYSFPLTAYHILDGFYKFEFVPKGTNQREPNAIFYKRVNNLIEGTSGSPMIYGNFVVSVDSATNCSPMLTKRFQQWLKTRMGAAYSSNMCVVPTLPDGVYVEAKGKTDRTWDNANPQGH